MDVNAKVNKGWNNNTNGKDNIGRLGKNKYMDVKDNASGTNSFNWEP